jgi:hypothetical protein
LGLQILPIAMRPGGRKGANVIGSKQRKILVCEKLAPGRNPRAFALSDQVRERACRQHATL